MSSTAVVNNSSCYFNIINLNALPTTAHKTIWRCLITKPCVKWIRTAVRNKFKRTCSRIPVVSNVSFLIFVALKGHHNKLRSITIKLWALTCNCSEHYGGWAGRAMRRNDATKCLWIVCMLNGYRVLKVPGIAYVRSRLFLQDF